MVSSSQVFIATSNLSRLVENVIEQFDSISGANRHHSNLQPQLSALSRVLEDVDDNLEAHLKLIDDDENGAGLIKSLNECVSKCSDSCKECYSIMRSIKSAPLQGVAWTRYSRNLSNLRGQLEAEKSALQSILQDISQFARNQKTTTATAMTSNSHRQAMYGPPMYQHSGYHQPWAQHAAYPQPWDQYAAYSQPWGQYGTYEQWAVYGYYRY